LSEYWLAGRRNDHEDCPVDPAILNDPAFKTWVKSQVDLARTYFQAGKRYLDEMGVLRCQIAAYWYCARFECVLDAIERDGYILRREYHERRKLSIRLRMAWLAISLSWRHFVHRGRGKLGDLLVDPGFEKPAA
jgi:hypothetical protein